MKSREQTGMGAEINRAAESNPVLATDRLSVTYRAEEGHLPAVRGVSLEVQRGESLGLVGESGSGKTTFAFAAIGYLAQDARVEGTSRVHGVDLLSVSRREARGLWGSTIGSVGQSPQEAFNPSLTIGRQLDEMGIRHLGLGRGAAREASLDMLARVALPDPRKVVERYPHQLSGGMLQRCAIAMALLPRPRLLILDEPTTALDVTTQARILELLADLGREFRHAILYVTHNLGVVSRFCDRVAVMYAGEVLEQGEVAEVFPRPLHPYTANLLRCIPRLGSSPAEGRLATLPGRLPSLLDLPPGCLFAPRCPLAEQECTVARPPLVQVGGGSLSSCLRWEVLTEERGREAAVHTRGTSKQPMHGLGEVPVRDGGRPAMPAAAPPLLTVRDAVKDFTVRRPRGSIRAVDGVSLSFEEGRTFGLVGESGSGKTTLARMVAGLTPPSSGEMSLSGDRLHPHVDRRARDVLRSLQMVFQSPDQSLNPRHTVRQELVRPLMLLGGLGKREARERAERLVEAVALPISYLDRYPGELSGGEKQRVAIARAFAAGPELVICDEPVSSLDVSVQGALLNLLVDLQDEAGTAYLLISHDLAAVQHVSHLIGVMYRGRLVEQGEAAEVMSPPYHPYTEALLNAVPDPGAVRSLPVDGSRLQGSHPPLSYEERSDGQIATGCPYHDRCQRYAGDVCRDKEPPWRTGGKGGSHGLRCHISFGELAALQQVAGRGSSSTAGPAVVPVSGEEQDPAGGAQPPGGATRRAGSAHTQREGEA